MTMGRPTESPSDIELTRELAHAHLKRHDTFLTGSADALRNHSRRTAELELAYARRFSADVVNAEQKVWTCLSTEPPGQRSGPGRRPAQ